MSSKKHKRRREITVIGAQPMTVGSSGAGIVQNTIPNPYTDLSMSSDGLMTAQQPQASRIKPTRPAPPKGVIRASSLAEPRSTDNNHKPYSAFRLRTDENSPHSKGSTHPNEQPLTEPYAVAIADFETDVDGDLCFKVGDTILLEGVVNESWHRGRSTHTGQVGIFPTNFVEIRVPLPEPPRLPQPPTAPIQSVPTQPTPSQPTPPSSTPRQPGIALLALLQPPFTNSNTSVAAPVPNPAPTDPSVANHNSGLKLPTTERPSSLGRLSNESTASSQAPYIAPLLPKPKSASHMSSDSSIERPDRIRVASLSSKFNSPNVRPETPPKPTAAKLAMAAQTGRASRGRVAALSSRFNSPSASTPSPLGRSLPSKPVVLTKSVVSPEDKLHVRAESSESTNRTDSLSGSEVAAAASTGQTTTSAVAVSTGRSRQQGLVAQLAHSLEQQGIGLGISRPIPVGAKPVIANTADSTVHGQSAPTHRASGFFDADEVAGSNSQKIETPFSIAIRAQNRAASDAAVSNQATDEPSAFCKQPTDVPISGEWLLVESDYTATEVGDLSAQAGTVVRCLDPLPPSSSAVTIPEGWLLCSTWSGEEGRLPSTFVRRLTDSQEIANRLATRPRAQAIAEFIGEDKEDLSFKAGELIYLQGQIDENWYRGESASTGQRGIFPINFTKILASL